MCKAAMCQTACPHGAILTDDNGIRYVDNEKLRGMRCLRGPRAPTTCPW